MKKKKIAIIFIVILCLNFFIPNVYALINENYNGGSTHDYKEDTVANSMLNVFSEIVMPIIYPFFLALENIVKKIIYIFSGTYQFPWADKIIFNRLEFLDVNFINPSPNSLFRDSGGSFTILGNIVRNVYFTILSICLAFLGIAVAVNAIKLMFSTIAGEKAKYKQMINSTILTIVLIFGMHYVISFVFYINEQLTYVASQMSYNILNEDQIEDAEEKLESAEDLDNEKLVENFWKDCNHTSLWSPVTILKKAFKEAVNLGEKLVNAFNNFVSSVKSFFGFKKEEDYKDVNIGTNDEKLRNTYYEKIFPSKDDFIRYFKDEEKVGKNGINIAAYLLKNDVYREYMLSMVAGNDTNKFSEKGIWGPLTSAKNTVLWFTGIIDTGLEGLQNLYNSVSYIYNNIGNENLNSSEAIQQKINEYTKKANNCTDEDESASYRIMTLYYEAYYRYVYDGNDKKSLSASSMIENLGEYFKRNSYYVDIEGGKWSPTTFNVIPSILYCVFVLQSFMFLFSYIKRLLYVVILAMLGPVTVIYDYIAKGYR